VAFVSCFLEKIRLKYENKTKHIRPPPVDGYEAMNQTDKTLNLDLIHKAQRGDRADQATLTALIRPKVYAYVYRMTLDVHTAEDLSQETIVSLIQNLQKLTINDPCCLWAWVYKTALNQIRDNYNRQRVIQSGTMEMKQVLKSRNRGGWTAPGGPEHLTHQELLNAVSKAINSLRLRYRNILTLRCFQELSYAEIAQTMGKSELAARLLFYRAKRSLVRQLVRDGFKKSQLLPALTLFAAATIAPIEKASATAVTAAAIHTGLGVKLLAIVGTTKLGIGIAAVAVLALIPLSTIVTNKTNSGRLFHIVEQPVVARSNLAYPAAIRASYDPDQSGWKGALESQSHTDLTHAPGAIRLEQWLDRPAGPDRYWLHIPKDHWIDITFGGEITDGEGDDIFITERCCHAEQADVFLVDDNENSFPLAAVHVPASGQHLVVTYGFDLAGLKLPFAPTAVRIKTTNEGYQEYRSAELGLELLSVRARVK
jgi:RNA polymerase sigma-70 factor (ECF subfamily)